MTIPRCFGQWLRREDGVSTVMLGLLIVPIIGFIGLAVDGANLYMVHSRLSYSTDAAALAGGKVFGSSTRDADVRAYFSANFPNGLYGATPGTPVITESSDHSGLTVAASAQVPTLFMRLFGFNSMTISASSTVEPQGGLEVALVLDVTGSMLDPSPAKFAAMKSGAKTLVNTLITDKTAADAVYIAVVPFRGAVNIGNTYKSWIKSGYDWTKFPSGDPWAGCVESRSVTTTGGDGLALDISSQVPSSDQYKFTPYLYENTSKMGPSKNGSASVKIFGKSYTIPFDNNWPAKPNGVYTDVYSTGPNMGCPNQPIVPLTNDKTKILAAIDAMTAINHGGTQVSEGAAWGWRAISDAWKPYWNSGVAVSDKRAKAIIILTDGENNVSDSAETLPGYVGAPPNYKSVTYVSPYDNTGDYTAHGRIQPLNSDGSVKGAGPLGATTLSGFKSKLNDKEKALCDALNVNGADNVTIYTIGYEVTATAAISGLKNCANNDPTRYYIDATEATITDAFKDIGSKLTQLRIVK